MTYRLEVLTNTVLHRKRRCEELFRLSVLERLEKPTTRPARPVGSAFHKGIELQSPEAASDHLRAAAADQLWIERERESLETWCAIVEAMVEGALRRWTVWPEMKERAFEVPLINPETQHPSTRHRFGGRIDGEWPTLPPQIGWRHRVDLGDELAPPAILELKSTGRLDEDYIRRLQIAAQPTAYLEAASFGLGRKVRTAVYRIVKKPGIRPHKGETDDEYRQRCEERKPLAPLKRKSLAKLPKTVLPVMGRAEHNGATYQPGPSGWVETDESLADRNRLRELERAPLTRKEPEAPEAFRERVRQDYLDRPDHYFAEVIVTRSDEQVERWRYETWEEHLRILAIENGGMTVRNDHSCLDYGRCDFFDLCTGQVGVEAFNVRPVQHPELETES